VRGSTGIDLGAGDDRVVGTDGSNDVIRCGPGDDTVLVDAGDTTRDCEHVTRRPPLTRAVTGHGRRVTLSLRSPWSSSLLRTSDAFRVIVAFRRPAGSRCAEPRWTIAYAGTHILVRLRAARAACRGRWHAQVQAMFLYEDEGGECTPDPAAGDDCGVDVEDIGPRFVFTLPRR